LKALGRRTPLEVETVSALSPNVRVSETFSTRRMVRAFLDYARKTKADLIVVTSLPEGRLDRLFLGSFAEALTVRSEIPVLVLSPRCRAAPERESILFPTDFSAESHSALRQLVSELGARPGIEIVLFHQFQVPMDFSPEPFVALPMSAIDIRAELKRVRTLGESWAAELHAHGYAAGFLMGEGGELPADGILRCATKLRPWMIAMVSESGPVGAALLGSTLRHVLRQARSPVWVVHREAA
jgi:nucleotide-binding universal stress UspA family protein